MKETASFVMRSDMYTGEFPVSIEQAEDDFSVQIIHALFGRKAMNDDFLRLSKVPLDQFEHEYEVRYDNARVGIVRRSGWMGGQFDLRFFQ